MKIFAAMLFCLWAMIFQSCTKLTPAEPGDEQDLVNITYWYGSMTSVETLLIKDSIIQYSRNWFDKNGHFQHDTIFNTSPETLKNLGKTFSIENFQSLNNEYIYDSTIADIPRRSFTIKTNLKENTVTVEEGYRLIPTEALQKKLDSIVLVLRK